MTKYLFITGGVISSLGKGITAAAIGNLLISRGVRIRMLKIDPYLNVDPGTMNPFQHGEVYVTDDGSETDLDLGHYERFTDKPTSKLSNITAGRIYWQVLEKERRGDYLGGTVQMIPHISNEIKDTIKALDNDVDIIICEIGGTVGDIEGLIFLEALRQLGLELGRENTMYVHLTYVPYIRAAGEVKTKPTQQSVAKLREIGIQPDVLICRAEENLSQQVREKLSLFCNVPSKAVIEEPDVETSTYEVPLTLSEQGLDEIILNHFQIKQPPADLTEWQRMINRIKNPEGVVKIGVVGKYLELQDAYKSIYESIHHAATSHKHKAEIIKISAEESLDMLKDIDGLIVPGGFGQRGIEGKIEAVRFAREKQLPFLGICLGMQCTVIEYARNVCGMTGADSTEFVPETPYPVVSLMEEQKDIADLGGTMRLGAWDCTLDPDSIAYKAYGKESIQERHRHRYELNNEYRQQLIDKGLSLSGINEQADLVEIVELKNHPWFVATQFHPELKSRPLSPHPLFLALIGAAIEKRLEQSNK